MTQRRFLHAADLHLELLRYGATQETQDAMLGRLVDAVRENAADAVVIAGDVFHTRRPGSAAIHSFARFANEVTRHADLIVTPGNHDGPGEVDDVLLKPAGWMAEMRLRRVHAIPGRTALSVLGMTFLVLPYIHRRGVLAPRAEAVVRELRAASADGPRVLVAHQTVAGARLSADILMRIGWDLTLDLEAVADFDAAMLGHIHHQQSLAPHVWYAGSPDRFDFGDEQQEKGFLLWEFDGPDVRVSPVSSGARQMVTLRGTERLSVPDGAVVRVLLDVPTHVTPAQRAEIDRDIRSALSNAAWVRVEHRLVREADARPRVDLDPSADALTALARWCEVNGIEYPPLEPAAKALVGS